MSIFYAILLGIVQGITEFLPVSSSGHLVLIQHYLPGFSQPGAFFDAILHFGTFIAVLIVFWKDIWEVMKAFFTWDKENPYFLMAWLIILGTIPAGLIGVLWKDQIELMFNSTASLSAGWLFTGILLILSDYYRKENKEMKDITWFNAIVIGVFQALALVPGVSRSGSTISVGLLSRLKGDLAAKFSFLLFVPAVGGAVILQTRHIEQVPKGDILTYIVAGAVALLVGIVSIKFLLRLISKKQLKYFGIYCLLLSLLAYLLV